MVDIEAIDQAIGEHGRWKLRLAQAIEAGKTDTAVEAIRRDDQCAFGSWLYGPTINSFDKASQHYSTVRELHAEFHQTAARIVELVSSGRSDDAKKMMAFGGEYSAISAKLTTAMMNWRSSLA